MAASATPRYEPAGWMHWPEHPAQSLYFQRLLGSAQEGGCTISECFLAASQIDPADPQSWHAGWMQPARASQARAEAAAARGDRQTAAGNFLRAAGYLRAAEQFLAPDDARREACFAAMLACSRRWLALQRAAGEAVQIGIGPGQSLAAYYLPSPAPGPAPAVIAFGGLDGSKDELLPRMARHAAERGVALLLVDLPGQGEALRLHGMANRVDVEAAVAPCIEFLRLRPEHGGTAIGLWGASLGGVYAARAASHEHRLAAVVSDGVLFDLAAALQARLEDGQADWALLRAVFGCREPHQVVAKARGLGLAQAIPLIRCPYLIVQGEHDFLGLQTALDAQRCALKAGLDVELKVFGGAETGASHCQADNPTLGQEFIWDWMVRRLRGAA